MTDIGKGSGCLAEAFSLERPSRRQEVSARRAQMAQARARWAGQRQEIETVTSPKRTAARCAYRPGRLHPDMQFLPTGAEAVRNLTPGDRRPGAGRPTAWAMARPAAQAADPDQRAITNVCRGNGEPPITGASAMPSRSLPWRGPHLRRITLTSGRAPRSCGPATRSARCSPSRCTPRTMRCATGLVPLNENIDAELRRVPGISRPFQRPPHHIRICHAKA